MQFHGYLMINQEKILVLVRENRTTRSIQVRASGRPGTFLEDESTFLSFPENQDLVVGLKQGNVIHL